MLAQGLRTDDPRAHRLGRVHRVVTSKWLGYRRARRIHRAIGLQAQPLDIRSAVAESLAAQASAGSVALHKLVVVRRLRHGPPVTAQTDAASAGNAAADVALVTLRAQLIRSSIWSLQLLRSAHRDCPGCPIGM